MPEPGSPEYNKFLAMKAYTYNLRGNSATINKVVESMINKTIPPFRPEFLEKTVGLLEPIRLNPVAVYLYVDALNILGTCYIMTEQQKSIEYLKKAEQTFEEFKGEVTNVNEALTPYEIFDVPREIQTLWCLMMAHHYTSIFLYSCYDSVNNEQMKLKYVMLSIRAKISIDLSKNNGVSNINNIMPEMMGEINFLIIKMHFAQVNHLLAAFMNNLVQYRRSLPPERRREVNFAQSLVSLEFANWAYQVVHYSFLSLTGNESDDIEPNYEFYAFDGLRKPGIEVYEDQFSCHQIQSHSKLKKAIKRGKAWCQRAIDLGESSRYSNYANTLMDQLNALEMDLEYFQGME